MTVRVYFYRGGQPPPELVNGLKLRTKERTDVFRAYAKANGIKLYYKDVEARTVDKAVQDKWYSMPLCERVCWQIEGYKLEVQNG